MNFVLSSEQEQSSVDSLKNQMLGDYPAIATDSNFNDTTILRFFRSNNNKESDAYSALKIHYQWRIDEGVDHIDTRKSLFQREIDAQKLILGKYDLNGRPASFCYVHRHSANDRDIEQMRLLTIWALEALRKAAKPAEEKFVIGFFLGKFSMKCMDYEVVKQLISILGTHYPDTLEALYLVDSPMIFSACWMVIRPWIDPVTASKVQFIKKRDLSNYFDPASIPSEED